MFCSVQQRTGSDRLVLLIFLQPLEGTLDAERDKVEPYSLQLQISLGALIGVNNTPSFSSLLPSVSCLFIPLCVAVSLSGFVGLL